MSHTIASTTVNPAYLRTKPADSDYTKVTRAAYSIDGYDPVAVTIKVGEHTAWVNVVCTAPGTMWREPDAKQRRRLVDEVLKSVGMARRGAVMAQNGWSYAYDINPDDC